MSRTARLSYASFPFITATFADFLLSQDPRSNKDASSDESGSEGDKTDSDSGSEQSGSDDDEFDDGFPRTPTKSSARRGRQLPTPSSSRGRRSTTSTPTKKRGRPAKSTSTAETGRAAKRRRFASSTTKASTSLSGAHNPLPPLLSASHLSSLTPFERAKALLHVSATPEALPCREDQRERIRTFLGDAILGRTGGCLYVHGVPGTGKTATVHSVVRELQGDPVRWIGLSFFLR